MSTCIPVLFRLILLLGLLAINAMLAEDKEGDEEEDNEEEEEGEGRKARGEQLVNTR